MPGGQNTLYKLHRPCHYQVEIKRSRFLVNAAYVNSLDATLAFFDQVKDPAATHNCWAYRIGQQYRFSDDGEPASTAGKPILAAIDGQGFDQVMVVVTRYFGGTKLGVGGLVRAYGGSASRCLQQADKVVIVPTRRGLIRAPFEHTGPIHQVLNEAGANRLNETFDPDGMVLTIEVACTSWTLLAEQLQNASRGAASLRPLV